MLEKNFARNQTTTSSATIFYLQKKCTATKFKKRNPKNTVYFDLFRPLEKILLPETLIRNPRDVLNTMILVKAETLRSRCAYPEKPEITCQPE